VFVGAVGFSARGPLSKVPENAMKCFVGIMLCAFGTFWVAEGFGVAWPGDAWGVLYLFAGWTATAYLGVKLVQTLVTRPALETQAA
jgi:uncharacterized membrane protein